MKKIMLIAACACLYVSCSKQEKKIETEPLNETKVDSVATEDTASEKVDFDIEKIPLTDSQIGDFPFFTLPEGLKSQNKPFIKNFDVCYFPINGVMTPFEGKLYKINVAANQGEEYSQHYFEKSMEDYLKSIGAVKIFDGKITQEEYDKYEKNDPNKGEDGDIGYANELIHFYVLRTKDQGNIYIQYTSNNASGKLNILQQSELKQTIKKVSAADITKDLNDKGKSVLYINFDVDKASLTNDGKELTQQIAQALKQDPSLKISIEGHTDNTGDATHNKKLSNDRALTVLNGLVADGIDKTRLSAKGFGADNPLVANDSEANKAKNRRVELIKK